MQESRSTQGRRGEHVRPIVRDGRVSAAPVGVWPMSEGRSEWAPEQVGSIMPDSLRMVFGG